MCFSCALLACVRMNSAERDVPMMNCDISQATALLFVTAWAVQQFGVDGLFFRLGCATEELQFRATKNLQLRLIVRKIRLNDDKWSAYLSVNENKKRRKNHY